MPELPEVETVKRRLNEVVVGKTIAQVEVLRQKSFQGDPQKILNQTITQVSRRAKLLRIEITGPYDCLVHLKMTGQLIYVGQGERVGGGHPTADWIHQLPGDHTRVIIFFKDETRLFFNDMRVFGWIKVADDQAVKNEFSKYGPDVNQPEFSVDYLQEKLSSRTIPIKQAILIGQIVGGIGNIYACEALYQAKIDPRKPAQELSGDELERLVSALKQVIDKAIKFGGTTFDGKYVDTNDLAGNYQDQLKVYGQEGETCPDQECDGKIEKIKISGRGTYFCSSCQK